MIPSLRFHTPDEDHRGMLLGFDHLACALYPEDYRVASRQRCLGPGHHGWHLCKQQ